jgi:hypothetical protein
MPLETCLLDKRLAEEEISLPRNPFIDVLERFGSCQIIAMTLSALGTLGASKIIGTPDNALKKSIISVTEPLAEKIGFIIPPIIKEVRKYNKTPDSRKEKIIEYVKRATREGTTNLVEDIFIQDPTYFLTMYAGLKLYPQTPPWILSIVSSLIATVGVSLGEVAIKESYFKLNQVKLRHLGFKQKDYVEARFLIRGDKQPYEAFQDLDKEFNLPNQGQWQFKDLYFEDKLPDFSKRTSKLRIRRRTQAQEQSTQKQSLNLAEIIFNRAYEMNGRKVEQYRFFPIVKTKLSYVSPLEITTFEEISDKRVRNLLVKSRKSLESIEVNFLRNVAYNKDMLVSLDLMHNQEQVPFYLIEIKSYNKMVGLLEQAMRYVMRRFPVLETTHEKEDLVRMNNQAK